ncbi:UNVERIFIED_CONTAM: hypothetical protein GTU68_048596 [Idotea baltica]|nr:hypothetical protein [Idotea baltica]
MLAQPAALHSKNSAVRGD